MSNNKKGIEVVVRDTGEFLTLAHYTTIEQQEYVKNKYKMTEENKQFNDEHGGFIFKEDSTKVDKLESNMTDSDIIKTLYLATYLDYDSYLKFDSGKIMDKSDVKQVIGVNKNLFGKWYNKMLSLKILTEDDKGIHMSKNYYVKGAIAKNKDYNRMFIEGTRQIYEYNKNSNHTMIGQMIRLLKYVNTHTNVLCWNPLESDTEKIVPITIGQLAKEFGYNGDEKKLMRAMAIIRVFDSHPLVLFFNDSDATSESYLMFHPKVCYSGKNDKMDEIYKMFVMMAQKYKDKELLSSGEHKLIRKGE